MEEMAAILVVMEDGLPGATAVEDVGAGRLGPLKTTGSAGHGATSRKW
jgi:hypothetical protein